MPNHTAGNLHVAVTLRGERGREEGWGVDDESDAKANWCVV